MAMKHSTGHTTDAKGSWNKTANIRGRLGRRSTPVPEQFASLIGGQYTLESEPPKGQFYYESGSALISVSTRLRMEFRRLDIEAQVTGMRCLCQQTFVRPLV